MTLSTIDMNDINVDGEISAAATRHSDRKLIGYIQANHVVLMMAVAEINKVAKKLSRFRKNKFV